MPDAIRIHVIVKGQVQGVYYRAGIREQALALGLTGWVRNLSNGNVEFEAQGAQEHLDSLLLWAQTGPPAAMVEGLSCNPCAAQPAEQDFAIVR